jgi:hypothetical protein
VAKTVDPHGGASPGTDLSRLGDENFIGRINAKQSRASIVDVTVRCFVFCCNLPRPPSPCID